MSLVDTEMRGVVTGLERVSLAEEIEHLAAAGGVALVDLARRLLEKEWESIPPVRISLAADLLGLDEKTVRAWAVAGVLEVAHSKPLKVTAESVHEVSGLLRELRAAGQTHGLLEAVWHRLQDEETVSDPQVQASLAQARTGQTHRAVIPEEYRHLLG